MINFFEEDVKITLKNKLAIKAWLKQVAQTEGKKIKDLNYVFCSDAYLLQMNQDYLNHDTFTDIITFDQSDDEKVVEGDIYISYERVLENGEQLESQRTEIYRVMVHGLLHLLGYKDKKKEDKALMTSKENFYINAYLQS